MVSLLILAWLILAIPLKTYAWGGSVHEYLCPQNLGGNCGIADDYQFKRSYPLGFIWHLCLDNKPDCPPRILAKYYVKKYFFEGRKDQNLLRAAAHLIQDANVPDHWFPMREIFGRIFVPFAPKWVGKTEDEVDHFISGGKKDWELDRSFQGKIIKVNEDYLDEVKRQVIQAISSEPSEELTTLEAQIRNRGFWQKIRSYHEWFFLALIILFPIVAWQFWQFKKTGRDKIDLIIELILSSVFLAPIILSYLFW